MLHSGGDRRTRTYFPGSDEPSGLHDAPDDRDPDSGETMTDEQKPRRTLPGAIREFVANATDEELDECILLAPDELHASISREEALARLQVASKRLLEELDVRYRRRAKARSHATPE